MNKTVNINLAGIFFHIDEDAYLKLSRYLEAIKRSFTDSQGRSEIISDIEARIAELFSERIQNEKQVVGIKLVDEVIEIMGQPEDYLVDDEIFEDEPQPKHRQSSKPNKKLYRDTDNSYIGGVAAGLGHYFGVDSIWIRLIWLLFAIGSGGTIIVIYLIFWALVPEAKTTAEKLTMTGDPVNISNIEKKIKDSIDSVSETVKKVDLKKHGDHIKETFDSVSDNISETVRNVDFQKQGSKLKSSSQTFFDTIGNILMFFLKVIAKFIGIILIITGISALIILIVAFFTVGVTDAIHFPGIDFLNAANMANIPFWLMSLILFFAVGIPFFFVFYLGLKILVNNLKSIGNIAKFTLLGLWLMSIIGLVIIGIKQATEQAYDASFTKVEETINIASGDTLKLKMIGSDQYNKFMYRSYHNYKISRDEDRDNVISATDIRLMVRSTTDSLGSIKVNTFARGSSYNKASRRAELINYNYALVNNELRLDSYLLTDLKNKFSDQHVEVIIYLPEGAILYADGNTHNFHQNSSYVNDILKSGMEEQYLKVTEDDVVCLDCEDKDDDDDSDKDDDNEEEDDDDDDDDDENEKEQKHDITVQVNENGVDIEVNDNSDN